MKEKNKFMFSAGRMVVFIGLMGLLAGCTTFDINSMIEEDKAVLAASDDSFPSVEEREDAPALYGDPALLAENDGSARSPYNEPTASMEKNKADLLSDNGAGSSIEENEDDLTLHSDSSSSLEDFQNAERAYRELLREREYNRPVKTQTIAALDGMSEVDQAYYYAKTLKPQEDRKLGNKSLYDDQKIMTDREIIRSILSAKTLDEKIDLDFDEIKLGELFTMIGNIGEVNIVLDPQYKNQAADTHLKQVTVEDALILVTSSYDLGMKIVGNSLFITSNEKLREGKIVSKVIRLKNILAAEAKTMIEGLVDSVSSSEQINTLIVRGLPDQLVKADRLIDMIDIPQPQVLIDAKIIEVNKDALRDLGVDWSDEIVLEFAESGRGKVEDVVLDPTASLSRIGKFDRTPIMFFTVIKMLEEQNKAKLLANPRIATLNGKDAEIFVGDKVPYTVTTSSGGTVTTEVRFVEPGIRLKITPSIVEDDFVVMQVKPEVSFIFAFRGLNGDTPQVKTRQAMANVRVKDQETVIIGGLIDQEDKESLSKVPFVGDLPWIGNLFTFQSRIILDTELIITVTPTVVRSDK